MLELKQTSKFKGDLKRVMKRRLPLDLLNTVILMLREQKALDPKYHDHELEGVYKGCRECHIQPDWLFIYRVDQGTLVLVAMRTGTHSDLF